MKNTIFNSHFDKKLAHVLNKLVTESIYLNKIMDENRALTQTT